MTPAKVIAEVGCVHLGSMDRAKSLIRLAALAGADYVKFQKRNPVESVPVEIQNQPHPNERFSYGNTYLEHRQALELSIEQHAELKEHCEKSGIGYSTSVWDMTSAKEVVQLNPDFIKIGSPSNTNLEMVDYLIDNYNGGLHISLGMTTEEELGSLFNVLFRMGRVETAKRYVLYHCTSEYPCPFEHLYLQEIRRTKGYSKGIQVGFSNHGFGIAADIAAYVLGASWIERHFVDDRTIRHTDAAASLEPDGLRRLCRDLKAVQKAMTSRKQGALTEEEVRQRQKLKYRRTDG